MHKIDRIGDEWDLVEVRATRKSNGTPLSLELSFRQNDQVKSVFAYGLRDYDVVDSLLNANRVEISLDEDSQLEFGKYTIECFGDGYSEYSADKVTVSEGLF